VWGVVRLLFIETAEPAGPRIIVTVPSENMMDLVHEAQGELLVMIIRPLTIELQELQTAKHRSISSAGRFPRRCQPGEISKFKHDIPDQGPGGGLFPLLL